VLITVVFLFHMKLRSRWERGSSMRFVGAAAAGTGSLEDIQEKDIGQDCPWRRKD
jgi:hypothetical protein